MIKDEASPKSIALEDPTTGLPWADIDAVSALDRRTHDRFAVTWHVDCVTEDTFLYASLANISAMGIFVRTMDPLPVGTLVRLSFMPPGYASFSLFGRVAWINRWRTDRDNPNPGMGVRFEALTLPDRERLVEVIRSIAYLREPS
jgi:type IV pilus assembly protein PilZ